MPLRSPEQKAQRAAELRARIAERKNPPKVEVLIPEDAAEVEGTGNVSAVGALVPRDQHGRILKGHSLNALGRPRLTLTGLAREICERRRLPQVLGEIGAGIGKYADTDMATRVKAIQLLLAYGYGAPVAMARVTDAHEAVVIKRVIGVTDANV
jgi:hypothetical protein